MSYRQYGFGYRGSKNDIAGEIVSLLPRADTFVDAFAGGCAVTHAALLSGKYEMVIANDISDAPQLFLLAVEGAYRDERRWISREEFHAKKAEDPYIGLVWSFGNNRQDYLYGRDTEDLKKALHFAVFHNSYTLLDQQGIGIQRATRDLWRGLPPYSRYQRLKRHVAHDLKWRALSPLKAQLQSLGSLRRLQSLESLRGYTDHLGIGDTDYEDDWWYTHPKAGSVVVYCDPPYKGTDCKGYKGFDHDRFYEWIRREPRNKFISEYWMPDDFVCVATFKHHIRSDSGCKQIAGKQERLWVHRDNPWRPPRQLTLFGEVKLYDWCKEGGL